MSALVKYRVGDYGQVIAVAFIENGSLADVSSAVVRNITFVPPTGTPVVKDADAGIVDSEIQYEVEDGLFTNPDIGQWWIEGYVELADGKVLHSRRGTFLLEASYTS